MRGPDKTVCPDCGADVHSWDANARCDDCSYAAAVQAATDELRASLIRHESNAEIRRRVMLVMRELVTVLDACEDRRGAA
jgi:tRNA(Ile2) C34 agmatinyltransferase TiaS